MIRAATARDFETVMRLYGQLNPDDPAITDGSDRQAFEQILADPRLDVLLWEHGGAVVATTYLNIVPNLSRSAAPYAVIENVVVENELRGTGVGKAVMAATLHIAWDAGCYKAMLMTGSKRPSTLGFYRACGFSQESKTAFLARPPS